MASAERTVYVDASALVKLVIDEPESGALRRYLAAGYVAITNEIAAVEVRRAVRLSNPSIDALEDAHSRLDETWRVELDAQLIEEASLVGPPRLRTLDAVHLVTALRVQPDVVVAYEQRLLDTARAAGLAVATPR